MNREKTSIPIPSDLYRKLVEYVERNRDQFGSVEEFVEFVLREVLKEEEEETLYSPEEEEEVKKRLRSLGYL